MSSDASGIIAVAQAVSVLQSGGVVGIPTETVYGLAARADNPSAIAQVFAAKDRPFFDPLIVHLAHPEDINLVAASVPPLAHKLIARFWPGPLSLVLPKKPIIADLVSAGLPTVAVRCPSHPLAREIIANSGFPLAAPSANLFGQISPTSAAAVWQQLQGRIAGVVDGGNCTVGVESTIVAFWEDQVVLLRPGGIALEDIEATIGPVQVGAKIASGNQGLPAPGVLPSHYAPQKPLLLYKSASDLPLDPDWRGKTAVLVWQNTAAPTGFHTCQALAPTGALTEAAANLYAYMRRLDSLPVERIAAVSLPETGLGRAINDRLFRAAGSKFSQN